MLLLAALLEINELNLLSLVNDKLVVKHLLYLYRRMQEMATVDNGTMGMEKKIVCLYMVSYGCMSQDIPYRCILRMTNYCMG